jgi:hypothetical protein
MPRLRLVAGAALLLAGLALPAAAQEPSAIGELIDGARRALNDLKYARTDSIARSLFAMGGRASLAQRVEGLQLMAAALYPEEHAAQQPDSARRYLEELVRATPDAAIPSAISWPGLDTLLTSVRATTFAIWATPESRYELRGADAEAVIEVAAARSARFRLTATAIGDGSSVVLDSAGPARSTTLRVPALVDDHPALPWGQYRLEILGIDSLSGEAVALTYRATVETPPFLLHHIPASPDSSLFRPERAARRPFLNAALGVALGAATAFAATAVRGSDEVGVNAATGRAYVVGAGVTVGALIGVFLDRGRLLPENIEQNAAVRAAFDERVRGLREENARRRAEYRAIITLQGGTP